jgi:hypothetical protein
MELEDIMLSIIIQTLKDGKTQKVSYVETKKYGPESKIGITREWKCGDMEE